MSVDLRFHGWWLPPGAAAIDGAAVSNGRLGGRVHLVAHDLDDAGDRAEHDAVFDLVGPGDVQGLHTAAIVATSPSRHAHAAEADKAVYVELAAPDLPWRYTIARPVGRALRPWVALLVGTADEITVTGARVVVAPSVLDAHPIARLARGCHVEERVGDPTTRPVARLISTRPLQPDRDHVAVVVPAYRPDGSAAWNTPAQESIELDVYTHWQFRTKAGGDFVAIARRLRLHRAAADLGTASLTYGPMPEAGDLRIAGALMAIGALDNDPPAPAQVAADLEALAAVPSDPLHPVLGLPDYTASWPPTNAPDAPIATSDWRQALRNDPRPRGMAGLGASAGIRYQDLLAAEAGRAAGAYEEALERLRRLQFGLLLSRSLWRRRVPGDSVRRLAVVGPALRDVLTAAGPVAETIRRSGRALGPTLFSSAAKRALRSRDLSDGAGPTETVLRHDDILRRATSSAPASPRGATAVAHTDQLAVTLDRRPLDELAGARAPKLSTLRTRTTELIGRFDRSGFDTDTITTLDARMRAVTERLKVDRPTAILPLLKLVDAGGSRRPDRQQLRTLIVALDEPPDSEDLAALAAIVTAQPKLPTTQGVDLDNVASAVRAAFDPTIDRPSLVERVVGVIVGIDDDPLDPQDLAPVLPLPAWRFLRDVAPDWLLPGAEGLPTDTVVVLTTNPAFVDAFLLGLNAQLLAELRFRNLPIIAAWTPLRTFWDRAHPASGAIDDDIAEIADWPDDSPFGSVQHQSPSASSADLVLLFNTPLFREYPGTVVYLVPVARGANGVPDWATDPALTSPIFPSFQGQLAVEQVYVGFDLDPVLVVEHWVVLEETVRGRRFWNERNGPLAPAIVAAADGAAVAKAAVSAPRRVLIRGDKLLGANPS